MWMTPPNKMCRQHLLGEHKELHMFVGCIRLGRNLEGYIRKKLLILDEKAIRDRHAALVAEMTVRGYNHQSPLKDFHIENPRGEVDLDFNIADLTGRCPRCRERMRAA